MIARPELGQLLAFQPQEFCSDSSPDPELDAFVLSLALAFNDLRDIAYFYDEFWQLQNVRATDSRSLAASGNFSGTINRLNRIRVGILVEALQLIEENIEQVKKAVFLAALRKLPVKNRNAWKDIELLALGKTSGKGLLKFRKELIAIRANGTFHYDQTKCLRQGFNSHFNSAVAQPITKRFAFLSLGKNAEATRFFFADAAVAGVQLRFVANQEEFFLSLSTYVKTLDVSIRLIVEAYLVARKIPVRQVLDEEIGLPGSIE